jgi:hypothetical protein
MPRDERPARAFADYWFCDLLAGQDSFVVDHDVPFAYEQPLRARSRHSIADKVFCSLLIGDD